MCALFGSGVNVHRVAVDLAGLSVQSGPLLEAPPVHPGDLLTAVSHRLSLEPPPVSSRPVVEGLIQAQSRKEPIQPLRAGSHDFGTFKLATRVRTVPGAPPPRVHKGLPAARELPVLKRVVPARFMTAEQVSYWAQRLGNAKRVSVRQVSLVGIFPNVPLQGDQPVQFRAEEGAIAFHLPEKAVPLSTVVVAKHAVTGEVLIGRFHAE